MNEQAPHIGKLICDKLKEDGRTTSWLAKKMSCDQSNIYKIFRKTNIDAIQLSQISIIMQFNFFDHYTRFVHENLEQKNLKK